MGKIEKTIEETENKIDYAKFDKGMPYYADRMECVRKLNLGFKFVSEAVYKLYIAGDSLSIVAEKLDYTPAAISYLLKKMGIERRPKGGSHNRSKTGVTGVCLMKNKKKYYSYYTLNSKQIYLGLKADFTEAVVLRRKAEIKYGYLLESSAEAYLKKNGIEISE